MEKVRESLKNKRLYTAAQTRALDRIAISEEQVSGYELMCRAGQALIDQILTSPLPVRCVACCCGGGNNGGDGFVVARLCREQGVPVHLFMLVDAERLHGEARTAYEDYIASGGSVSPLDSALLEECDTIVDALLGTGLDRDVQGVVRDWIEAINAANARVVSADLPSGLDADTGHIRGCAVRAETTVTFIGIKRGLLTGSGVDCVGRLVFSDLNVAPKLPPEEKVVSRSNPTDLLQWLPPRARSMHKGQAGRVLIIGGAPGYAGAVMLAGQAALRGGAGLVSVATHPESKSAIAAHCAELMVHAVRQAMNLDDLLSNIDCVLIGPGLGQSAWAKALLATALKSGKPLVLDADALNLMAQGEMSARAHAINQTDLSVRILTPHPGEAARLMGSTIAKVEADRFACAATLSQQYKSIVVLKGAGTIVSDTQEELWLCDRGNPGMATGGMGDVLGGLIAALLAQGLPPIDAVRAGVLVHAMAGDDAAIDGMRGMCAHDLLPLIRKKVNPCL